MNEKCTFKVIRVDGTEEVFTVGKAVLLHAIHKMLKVETCDTVGFRNGMVMMVDDTGMVDGKPVNSRATMLYWIKCGGPTPNSIHGDVAICTDQDFA